MLGSFFEKNYDLNPFLKLILDQLLDNRYACFRPVTLYDSHLLSFSDSAYLSLTLELLRELSLGPQMTPIVTRLFDNYVQYRKEAKQNLEYGVFAFAFMAHFKYHSRESTRQVVAMYRQ